MPKCLRFRRANTRIIEDLKTKNRSVYSINLTKITFALTKVIFWLII